VAVSIEDPIEFELPYLRQLEVDENHGVSMYQGLRSLLRMDPDVILVGEIRDEESAITAAQAALGGRLVMATIHAKDTSRAVEAMHYLSVPYHVIGSSLRLIIAQDLVRRICPECAKPRPIRDHEKELFKRMDVDAPAELLQPVGCTHCHSYGYHGRIGIFETAVVDEKTAEIITSGPTYQQILESLSQRGMHSALVDGLGKVAQGVTSMDEIWRVYWPYGDRES
jgi:type II secretory ATPase GspE/PulE/Tfp pilus assembly ATPase PilB-like protein